MFDRTVQYLYAGAKRASLRYYALLIACVLLALAWNSPAVHVEAAMKPYVPARRAAESIAPDSARLDLLRYGAASGDEFSNRELTIALLDRYDLSGNSDDLYEALVWVDRRWDESGKAELAARVIAQYCEQRVIRWHRFCLLGE